MVGGLDLQIPAAGFVAVLGFAGVALKRRGRSQDVCSDVVSERPHDAKPLVVVLRGVVGVGVPETGASRRESGVVGLNSAELSQVAGSVFR